MPAHTLPAVMNKPYTASLRLRDLAVNERPQERLEKHGPAALSDTELLAMLLRSGSKGMDVLSLSSLIISEAGSLAGLLTWSDSDFKKLKGIGKVKALQLITVMEMARRILTDDRDNPPNFTNPEEVYRHFTPLTAGLEVEKFWVLCLNRKNRLIKRIEVTSGTATTSLAHPREVYREAIRLSASGIICAHNHPSGDPAPSLADLKITRLLRDAAKTVEIDLLGHVIIGRPKSDPLGKGYYSFNESGNI